MEINFLSFWPTIILFFSPDWPDDWFQYKGVVWARLLVVSDTTGPIH